MRHLLFCIATTPLLGGCVLLDAWTGDPICRVDGPRGQSAYVDGLVYSFPAALQSPLQSEACSRVGGAVSNCCIYEVDVPGDYQECTIRENHSIVFTSRSWHHESLPPGGNDLLQNSDFIGGSAEVDNLQADAAASPGGVEVWNAPIVFGGSFSSNFEVLPPSGGRRYVSARVASESLGNLTFGTPGRAVGHWFVRLYPDEDFPGEVISSLPDEPVRLCPSDVVLKLHLSGYSASD